MTQKASIFARRASFTGASLAALVMALATPAAVRAQSFNGTGTATGATITTSAGHTDIAVNSAQAVIDWTTNAPASGTVVFQNAGTTATFAGGVSFVGNYTVLNRVTPVDAATGAPTAARIQFDGTVNSTAGGGLAGGNIWFYSPNGIVIGSTASFNVGGLVLTTNPIDTTGGFFGSKGEIRFRGSAGSTGLVQIQPGASITAFTNPQIGTPAYVAIVAPRIEQGGTVTANGSIGYVAAESADVIINAGFFDIFVNAGTTDGNGIVHTGTTTGAASAGATDPRTIYMVAVPKNDGLTMLLNGNIGYAAAASASDDGAAVILSAGHGLNYDAGSSLTNPANIAIGDALFSSVTTATATDAITVTPTTLTRFDRFTTLNAFNTVSLTAGGSAQILANDTIGLGTDYSLDILSGNGGNGGAITLSTSGSGAISAAGRVRLRAEGDGFTATSGADGTGGTIAVNLLGGTFSAANLDVSATGQGGFLLGNGGTGQGGTISILSQGDFNVGALNIDAGGASVGGDGNGGNGTGGNINLTAGNGGTITTQSISLTAIGTGGSGIGFGGIGRGGTISVLASGNGTIGASTGFIASASGVGGDGRDGNGGDAFGGGVSVAAQGSAVITAPTALELDARASSGSSFGPSGTGGIATGGTATLLAQGGTLNLGDTRVDAGIDFGAGLLAPAGPNQAGTARVEAAGGVIDVAADLSISANASLQADLADLHGGDATGGQALLLASNAGSISVTGTTAIDATGQAGLDTLTSGIGGVGSGGSIRVEALTGGTITLSADAALHANGYGGDAFGAGGLGGAAIGGNATVNQDSDGAIHLAGSLTLDSNAYGGANAVTSAVGGRASGGTSSLTAQAGTLRIDGDATLVSNPTGGANPDGSFAPTVAGLIVLGGIGGTTAIGGSLSATAIGDAARPDGKGFDGAGGGTITVVGDTLLRTTGGIALSGANLATTGMLTVTSDTGAIASTGVLSSGNAAAFQAPGGLALATLQSGGTTSLQSAIGAITVNDLLSTGAVTVTGTSVDIFSNGGLAFTAANATAGNLAINVAGDLLLGAINATGATTLRSRNAAVVANGPVNGASITIAAGTNAAINTPLTTPGALNITAGQAINLAGPASGATIALTGGTDVTTQALTAASTIGIGAGGSIITSGNTTADTIRFNAGQNITTNGALTAVSLIDMTAGGAIDVNAAIDPAILRMTAGTSITIDAPAVGGAISLTSGSDIVLNAALTATGTLDMTAGRTIAVNAFASGAQVTATSADIVIVPRGQIGQRSFTQSVSLIDNAGANPTFIGGTGGVGGYSLDSGELLRVFADGAIRFSVAGLNPAPVSVGNLALAFGANGNIGTGGTLALTSSGRIAVLGDVALTTSSGADALQINAGRLDVATDTGGIALLGPQGTLQGTLDVTAGTFAVATTGTLVQLAPSGSILINTALMDNPSGAKGGVSAGAINADIVQGIYVQNAGLSGAFADRRGFATNTLAIGTASNATQIVINGVTFDTTGNPITGQDTVGTVTVNGIVPTGGGLFDPRSSVNGCIIGLRCGIALDEPGISAKPDLNGPPDPPGTGGNPSLASDTILQVEVRKSEPSTLLPLVDEPVTGVGNEDLWGDRCASGKEDCEGGN